MIPTPPLIEIQFVCSPDRRQPFLCPLDKAQVSLPARRMRISPAVASHCMYLLPWTAGEQLTIYPRSRINMRQCFAFFLLNSNFPSALVFASSNQADIMCRRSTCLFQEFSADNAPPPHRGLCLRRGRRRRCSALLLPSRATIESERCLSATRVPHPTHDSTGDPAQCGEPITRLPKRAAAARDGPRGRGRPDCWRQYRVSAGLRPEARFAAAASSRGRA